MFVLAVKFRILKGNEKVVEEIFRKARGHVHEEEEDVSIYDMHRRIGDSSEILFYERYKDRNAWEKTHMSKPYIKELVAELPKYIEGDMVIDEYELVEFN